MASMVMFFMVVALLLAAAPAGYAASYTVGGSSGWAQGVDYNTWAADKTFTVGDTLVFNYQLNHAVDQVIATAYGSCSSASPIKSYRGGATTITLSAAGPWYFICPTGAHCANGQALQITVAAATTPSPPGVVASPPPPGTTDTTPSPPPPGTTSTTSSPPPPASKAAGGSIFSGLRSLVCVIFVALMSVPL